jgi:hypothetical protein
VHGQRAGWWHSYDDVLPSWFRIAIGPEEPASLIRACEPQVAPRLLQTEGCIRAITAASFPAAPQKFAERAVALRLARQHLLSRPGPPGYRAVLDERVLRRPIGGRTVMRAQLGHLATLTERPSVTGPWEGDERGHRLTAARPAGHDRCRASTVPGSTRGEARSCRPAAPWRPDLSRTAGTCS